MGSISSGVGLVSGINSGQIIDQLISLDARPRTQLLGRIENNRRIKLAYADLQARLSGLQTSANTLVRPSTFLASTGTSSNADVLTASVSPSAAAGSYQFTVARTVTSQSLVSTGLADANAFLRAGTIRVGLGGGEVTSSQNLADLNSGAGVRRGQFRIVDRSGASTVVDTAGTVNLDDVIKRINTAPNLQVRASLGDSGLVLTDTSGGTGTLRIDEVGGGNAAGDLGLRGTATGNTLAGTSINTVGRNSTLASLNDGLGVRTAATGNDLRVTLGDGSTLDVSLAGAKTVGDVIDKLNDVGDTNFTASISPDGRGFRITDNSGGANPLTITALNNSKAARDLGFEGATGTGSVTGSNLRAGLGSVLLKNLRGGVGVNTGSLLLTDRAGNDSTVSLAGANSLSDLIGRINSGGNGVRAAVNRAGTGLEITDVSGGSGDLVIGSASGPNVAGLLGIEGTFNAAVTSVDGGSLKRQFISENSSLASLNGGRGIAPGTFRITNSLGATADINLSGLTNPKLSDVIARINAGNIGVTASINEEGNGLLLTDTNGGASKLTVADRSGSAAADLRIAGTATNDTIDGALAKDIEVTSTDTLNSLIAKLNAAKVGVSASLINDGTGANPFRLSLNSLNSGEDGRFTIDTGSTGIQLDTLVRAQNAAVFLGSSSATNPVLLTSSSNTLSNVLPGVSLNLNSASTSAVTLNVVQNADTAVSTLKSFVSTFNGLTTRIADLTKFDTATNAKGLLLGDAAAASILTNLFSAVQSPIRGAGRYSLLSQVGVTVGEDNQLSFDETKFKTAYAADPLATQRLFTAFNTVTTTTTTSPNGSQLSQIATTTPFGTDSVGTANSTDGSGNAVRRETKLEGFGLGYSLQKSLTRLIDPVNGLVVQQGKTIDEANKVFENRIASISILLNQKRSRLQRQFANMETILSQLQSQQTAIGRISSISVPSNNR